MVSSGPMGNVWIETNVSSSDHGGAGWEYGTCLWSPSTSRNGSNIYSQMRECLVGDHVFHIRRVSGQSMLTGRSTVAKACVERKDSPPNPGDWDYADSFLRVDLKGHERFQPALPIGTFLNLYAREIVAELVEDRPKHYPFVRYRDEVRLGQGLYLTKCTSRLLHLLLEATRIEAASVDARVTPIDVHREFSEGKRVLREASFFARNPALVRLAKEHYGPTCMACGFNFEAVYGEAGRGYCECHHTDPLSERPESEQSDEFRTNLEGVRILCANCHRIVHRQRPAMPIDELRRLIEASREPQRGLQE